MSELRLRLAGEADLAGIVEVFWRCWTESHASFATSEELARLTHRDAEELWRIAFLSTTRTVVTTVATADARIVGFLRHQLIDGELFIHSLYVDPSLQGRGLGGRLMRHALQAGAAAGANRGRLWVFTANQPARAFYREYGWLPDGRTRIEDGFGMPEVGLGTLSVAATRTAETLVSPEICTEPGESPPAGAAVALARGDEQGVAVAGTRGSADRPVTLDTRWDVASVTKLVTTTIGLGLVSAGILDLDAPVDALLPELTGRGITARSLLQHESGLLPWQPLDRAGAGPDTALATIAALPTGTPGEHAYSDLGLITLGVLLTRLTGDDLSELLRRGVNEPLGLDLHYGPVDEPVADSAPDDRIEQRMVSTGEPYPVLLQGPEPAWQTEPFRGVVHDGNARRALGGISAHAGIFATIGDLLRLGLALSDGPDRCDLWAPEAYRRFLEEPLGFRTRTLTDGSTLHHHPGFTGCALGFVAGEHRAYAVAANRLLTSGTPVPTERLWRRVLDDLGGLG
ncbi:hypothetical protein CGZ98_05175 [Enemella evansiae]|uniref:GNAT family N-acetyltransferase n=1 Tax=Enemella evansiae TaxID=2016499 RepID=UPI000B97B516|nr:GNAT family N-acetyltransferase [Enemella evansiae]OYO13818.1 hypothetical protein CGZ98_05175 [Enemella evansiae]